MTATSSTGHTGSDGLWRWLVGGLAAGGAILGLLIGAYEIGYHRGQGHATAARAATPAAPTTTTAVAKPKPKPAGGFGPVTVTPALVARGTRLYEADGCASCHSLSGAAGAGPSFKGVAGRTVELVNGKNVAADDAYLARSIVEPDAQVVKGYRAGIMGPAIATHDLGHDPASVRALVAFLKAQK